MKSQDIVILHGWGITGSHFLPLVKELEQYGYSVFSPDLPGFGKNTSVSRPYSLLDYVTYIHEYIRNHKIEHPIFIGHSFGGRVSLKYAYMYKKNVRAIILSGTPGISPVNSIKRTIFTVIAKIGKVVFDLPVLRSMKQGAQRNLYLMAGAKDFYRAEGNMPETFKQVIREDLQPYMEKIHVPVLLVWGNDDALVPLGVAKRMKRAIPGSQLLVMEGDHCVSYKKPAEFMIAIKTFLTYI